MRPERITFGERLSSLISNGMRSWTFLCVFLATWFLWWYSAPPPGGWWHFFTHFSDPFPYVFQGNWEANLTFLDLIVYGIAQRWQSVRLDAMMRAQTEMMRAIEAQTKAILPLLERDVAVSEKLAEFIEEEHECL
jgi:hypothetical protein